MNKIKKLKEKVLKELELSERARNDDIHLQCALIMRNFNKGIKQDEDWKWWISVEALRYFRETSIQRLRGKIQNDEWLFLPTDPKVRKFRKIKQENWYYEMSWKMQGRII